MTEVPYGAIRTVEEAKELIAKAPIKIYRVDSYLTIWTRELRSDNRISYIYSQLLLDYYHPASDMKDTTGANLNSQHVFLFTNYWHAWAYLQKLKSKKQIV